MCALPIKGTSQNADNLSSNLLDYDFRSNTPFRTLLGLYRNDLDKIGLSMLFYVIKHSPEWIRPLVIANIIDIISNPAEHSLSALWINGAFLAVAIVQNIPTHFLHISFMSAATRKMETHLRSVMTRRLQQLSIGFYKQRSSGALQSKLLRDVEAIQLLTTHIFQLVPSALLTILVATVATTIRAPWFLLFFVGTVPTAAAVVQSLRDPLRDRNRVLRQRIEDMSARLIEMIKLIPVTRAHGVEEAEIQRINWGLMDLKRAAMRVDAINAVAGASAWVTLRLFNCACLLTSAWLAFTGQFGLTVGDVVLLTGYFDSLTNSIVQILTVLPQISRGFESIRSVGEVLECPDLECNQGKTPIIGIRGEFWFESVNFVYPGSEKFAIQDFSLQVSPGETIAIIGPSGAGKSTLINLIIGFLRPTQGQIYLDGWDMNTLDLRTYRQFLSVVSQETVLFEGSIRENILYGAEDMSESRLIQATQDANALEFIDKLPQGLNTLIGENGAKLSGGQRQRIAIARALIRNPRVLILDEATASLDTASEALIQEALEHLLQNRTTFGVAHRLSTIRQANRIVVLDSGYIVEIGPHQQLLTKDGLYAQLHALQT